MKPGIYDLVAAGPQGIAAVSFEVVGNADETSSTNDVATDENEVVRVSISLQDDEIPIDDEVPLDDEGIAETFDIALTNAPDSAYVAQTVDSTQEFIETEQIIYEDDDEGVPFLLAGDTVGGGVVGGTFGGGGFGGGGFGGGGGLLGGGSRLGRLLGIGGIITGIIALADDDDGNGGGASPFEP